MEVLCGLNQVYNLSAGKSIPDFLQDAVKKKHNHKNQDTFKNRLEIINDFEFSASCNKVCMTQDGEFFGAIGTYPPTFKLYETEHLSSKHIRQFDSEPIDFLFLSDDYRKIVFLLTERLLEFHAQGGKHHRLRIPCEGRHICCLPETAQLVVSGSSNLIHRLDLERGSFLSPLESQCEYTNVCVPNPSIPFFISGGEDGIVEVWDTRVSKCVNSLKVILPADIDSSFDGSHGEVTSAAFSSDGLSMCVGTSHGICRLYDIRSNRHLCDKDHCNDSPIVSLNIIARNRDGFGEQDTDKLVISADRKSIKIWNASKSSSDVNSRPKVITNIEPPSTINGVCHCPNSGLIFVPQDQPKIGIYFIPQLGIAPRWCSFLESLTEELEESKMLLSSSAATRIDFEDKQFVTSQQLKAMGVAHIINTSLLRPHLHGYLLDTRLYAKLKAISEPYAAEKYRKEQINKKLIAKRSMRIQKRDKATKVNAVLADKLETAAKNLTTPSKATKKLADAATLLKDRRFEGVFNNPEFAIVDVKLPRGRAK